jgi:hypothetical protein
MQIELGQLSASGLGSRDWVARLVLASRGEFVLWARDHPGNGVAVLSGSWVRQGADMVLHPREANGEVLVGVASDQSTVSLPPLAVENDQFRVRFLRSTLVLHRISPDARSHDDP